MHWIQRVETVGDIIVSNLLANKLLAKASKLTASSSGEKRITSSSSSTGKEASFFSAGLRWNFSVRLVILFWCGGDGEVVWREEETRPITKGGGIPRCPKVQPLLFLRLCSTFNHLFNNDTILKSTE